MEQPVILATAAQTPTAGAPAPDSRRRILVVDDEPELRRLNTEILRHSGYHVDAAEDGAAAWTALQLNRYDLLVTDNDMPKISGVELLKKVHATNMALPVIMATGTIPDEEFERHPVIKPAVTLLKPYTIQEFLSAVRDVLNASATVCGEMGLQKHLR
jgi:DNA-binding response OmpR family regulator